MNGPVTRGPRLLRGALLIVGLLLGAAAGASETLVPYRDQIEQAYQARDSQAIEATMVALRKAGDAAGQQDLATYYVAFGRLRQSALPGLPKDQAREYLEQCIAKLAPVVARRKDDARARALYASCLGSSANHYVLRSATRGFASSREISAAMDLAPDDPWVVLQDAVIEFMTPAMFGGSPANALGKLRRAEQLFVASRPSGSFQPVFGESETWLYIGRVHLALGQTPAARQALQKARSLAPGNADVRDELQRL